MKLIIDISEGLYKHIDTIQNGSIGAKQVLNAVKDGIPAYKAIPSAEPREVLYSVDGYADGVMVYNIAKCPSCDCTFEKNFMWGCNYCPHCGQGLKWEGEEGTVTPQPKTGHWIEEDMFDGDVAYRCSECNELFWIESGTPKDNEYNFCPKCGKRLVEPQESEE